MCDPIVVVNYELQHLPSLNIQTHSNSLELLTLRGLKGNEVVPIRGHASKVKIVNAYPVGVSVKSNGA